MSWAKVARYYGLQAPYKFQVAIPFLLSASVLLLMMTVALVLFVNAFMIVGTVRYYFFLYIAALSCLALVTSRVWGVSYAILCWCTIELSLALLSGAGFRFSDSAFATPLFPENTFAQPPYEDGFAFHPLLHMTPRPNWTTTIHYDTRLRGVTNLPFNWQELEKNIVVSHNSFGLRGAQLTAKDVGRELIFTYGGSTTYDMHVSQGETWPERLQFHLNDRVTVVNFGVLGHGTTEHLIHTAFYQNILKKKPICAVYYAGWNDMRWSHAVEHDAAYANFQLLAQVYRKPGMSLERYSPTLRLVSGIARSRFDSVPRPPSVDWKRLPIGPDLQLEEIFVEHLKTIAAINHAKNVRTVFIGQLANREYLSMAEPQQPGYIRKGMWSRQERFNSLMKQAAMSVGAKYIDAGIKNFRYADFTDHAHFSNIGSEKFATLISSDVDSYCH